MKPITLTSLDLYEFRCNEDLIDRVLSDIQESTIFWDPREGVSKAGYMDKDSLKSYYHEELFTWLQQCVDEVAAVHYPDKKLSVSDSWLTQTKFSDTVSKHNHKFSIVSGLLYLTTHTRSETNFFFQDSWMEPYQMFNLTGPKQISIKPEKGKLLLFRSDIYHSVEPHTDIKNTRYSLAFNAFFSGTLSDHSTMKLNLTVNKS
jgi:hypothetical protein